MVLKNQNWTTFGLVALTLPLALPRDRLIKHGWTFKLMDFFYKVSFSPATGYYKNRQNVQREQGSRLIGHQRKSVSLTSDLSSPEGGSSVSVVQAMYFNTNFLHSTLFFSVTTQKTRFRQKQMKEKLNSSNRKKLLERSRKKQMKEKLKSSNRKKLLGRSRKTRPRKIVSKTRSSHWEGKCCRELRCE